MSLFISSINKILLIAISITLFGCDKISRNSDSNPPLYQLNTLDLKQKKPNGMKDWDLTSPEVQYDLTNRLIKGRNPQGIIYINNLPSYNISASNLTVIDDGDIIELKGDIIFSGVGNKRLLIKGDLLRWKPQKSSIQFIGDTYFERFNSNNDGIVPNIILKAKDAIWDTNNGIISALGPVTGIQKNPDSNEPGTISATSLKGNLKETFIDLSNCSLSKTLTIKTNAYKCTLKWDSNGDNHSSKMDPSSKEMENNIDELILFSSNNNSVETLIVLPDEK